MKKLRVYEIVFSFDIESGGGGISRFATSLCLKLDRERFEPVLCALWDRGSTAEKERIQQLAENGIRAFTCAAWDEQNPYRAFVRAYLALRQALKRQPADIVHSHSSFGDMAAVCLKLEGKAPVLIRTLHNELRTEWSRRPLRRLLFTNLLDPLLFKKEIGVSQFIKDNLDARWLAKRLRRKAQTIYNALDIGRFERERPDRQALRRALGIPEDAYLVGSVGRLVEQKGYDVLVEAAALVCQRSPESYFIIVGDGEQAEALKHQAAARGIAGRMIFTGPRSDVESLLETMDLFVCSSRWEGLSTVLMEAMAAGVPVVATDIPGNRELLTAGMSAWMVPAEDTGRLAEAMLYAQEHPEQARAFAQAARQEVEKVRIERIAEQHAALYMAMVQK